MNRLNVLLVEPISKHSLFRFGRACKNNNWHCDLLITKNNSLISLENDCNEIFQFDSLNQNKEELLLILNQDIKYDAVIPASEFAVPMSEKLADALGLYHNPLDLVDYYRDKSKMREIFERHTISQPKVLYVLTEKSELDEILWNSLSYPVVTKPSEAAGSVMVRICYNQSEVKEAVSEILEFKESRVTNLSFNNKALIEEAVLGPEYSVEILINNDEIVHSSVTTKIISQPPFCEELGHIVGNKVPRELLKKINKNIEKIKNAWKIKNGVIHAEFKVKNNEVYFIEAAARIAGDMISELVELAYGLNMEEAFILSRAGQKITKINRSADNLYGIRFIFEQRDVERIKNAHFIESSDVDYNVDSSQPAVDFGFSNRKGRAILISDIQYMNEMYELISG